MILLLFPPIAKPKLYLRPWDDNIEEVFKAAIKLSESSTRANWETENVTVEADRLAKLRRWDDTLKHEHKLTEDDEERPWDEYDFYDEAADYGEEEDVRVWDDKFDRIKNKFNLFFADIPDVIERGKPEPPPEDLSPYFKQEINIGEDIVEKSKKGK